MAVTDLSIIIVGLNTKQYLLPCLGSIIKSSVEKKIKMEIIYVDNGSTDGSIGSFQNLKIKMQKCNIKLKIIENKENLGFTRPNNQGAGIAEGKYLFFLNSDTVILDEALVKMTTYLNNHPEVGILGPKLFNSQKKDLQRSSTGKLDPLTAIFAFSFLNKYFPNNYFSRRYFLTDWSRETIKEVAAVSGAALMIRAELFRSVGGFDERFFIYFEENDLCLAVEKKDKKVIYFPEAQVIHYGGRATQKIPLQMKKAFKQSRYRFFEKHYGLLAAIVTEGLLRFFEFLRQ